MPRKARIDAPSALHHIILRGIERKAIFIKSASKERPITEARRVLCYIAVRKLGYKCSDVSKAMGISAVTVSKAVSLGSELSEVDKIQKQMLDN